MVVGVVSRVAVMSRISLWRMVGKPPVWHTMAWSMVNAAPQLQVCGVFFELPVVSEADSIMEFSLVKKETMVGEWESYKPR